MRDCGDKRAKAVSVTASGVRTVSTYAARYSVKDDARAEFARQASELVASLEGKPDHERRDAIVAELDRFGQPRYALVADDALAVLREALG